MTEPSWRIEARQLKASGMSNSAIAQRFGRSQSAVWKAVNPDRAKGFARRDNARPGRRAQKDAWDEQARLRRREELGVIDPPYIPGVLWVRDKHGRVIGRTLVDDEDWEQFKDTSLWFVTRHRYVGLRIGVRTEYLHRAILGLEPGQGWGRQTDHINRDPTDNRRRNLRVVTPKENCANRGGIYENRSAA